MVQRFQSNALRCITDMLGDPGPVLDDINHTRVAGKLERRAQ